MNCIQFSLAVSRYLQAQSQIWAGLTGSGISAICSFALWKFIFQTLSSLNNKKGLIGLFILKYRKQQLWSPTPNVTTNVWHGRKGYAPV